MKRKLGGLKFWINRKKTTKHDLKNRFLSISVKMSLFPAEAHFVASLLDLLPLLPVPDDLLLHPRLDDVAFLKAFESVFQQVALGLERPKVAGELIGKLQVQVLRENKMNVQNCLTSD